MELNLIMKDQIITIPSIHMVKNTFKIIPIPSVHMVKKTFKFTKTRKNRLTKKKEILNIQRKKMHRSNI